MTSGDSAISSAMYWRTRSAPPATQRVSIRTLRPSIQPSSRRPRTNASIRACPSLSSAAKLISTPMRRIRSGCCARVVTGHAAAEPTMTLMKSRRLVCRASSILRGGGGRFTTPPPSRLEARSSFNHLVGDGEHSRRNSEAERLGGGEIDDNLEVCWLQNREVGGLFTLKYSAHVGRRLAD